MKITFLLIHMKISGGGRAILEYADLLQARGHEVTVVVEAKNAIRRIIANILKLKPYWFKNLRAKVLKVPSLDERDVPKGDVVMATNWPSAFTVSNYSEKIGKKFYLIQHYESLYHGLAEKVDKTYRLPLRKIVISTWLKDMMREKFEQDSDLIVTPVDLKLFRPIEGLKGENELRILMLHHEAKWKGVELGLEVFRRIKIKYPNIKLKMFGLKKHEAPTGFSKDDYIFDPDQKDLAKLYSSCDIYLCPSEYEGLGMPGMEAMACKCALVTFDTGGSRDYAIDGQTAFVAEHNNIDDLERKLELAVSNTELRHKIAENGYNFIISQFSWDKAIDRIEEIFKNA